MSTDTRPPLHPTPSKPQDPPRKPALELSATQVVAGALAAMTAAYLGSRLSLAGTVVGAALASVVAAVAGSLYTASLRTTRHRVRTVLQGRATGPALPTVVNAVPHRGAATVADRAPAQPSAPAAGEGRSRYGWKNILVAAAIAFSLAGVALTGLELATGSALSGGQGTTISQVAEPRRNPDAVPAESSPRPWGASPTATPGNPSTPAAPAAPPVPSSAPTTTTEPSAPPAGEVTAPAPPVSSPSIPTAQPPVPADPVPSTDAVPSAAATPGGTG